MRISDDVYRYELARWLEKFYGVELSRDIESARSIWKELAPGKQGDEEFFLRILAKDPLDSSANFNLALIFVNENDRPNEAMWLFWASAIYNPEDAEAWKNAYFSAHNANDVQFMLLSLSQLIYHCGGAGYDLLRQQSLEAGVPADVHGKMDELAYGYLESYRNSKSLGTRAYMATDAQLFDDGVLHFDIGN